ERVAPVVDELDLEPAPRGDLAGRARDAAPLALGVDEAAQPAVGLDLQREREITLDQGPPRAAGAQPAGHGDLHAAEVREAGGRQRDDAVVHAAEAQAAFRRRRPEHAPVIAAARQVAGAAREVVVQDELETQRNPGILASAVREIWSWYQRRFSSSSR